MGCGKSANTTKVHPFGLGVKGHVTDEQLKVVKIGSSDLHAFRNSDDKCNGDADGSGSFSLARARDTCILCRLVYMDGVFWSSAKAGKGCMTAGADGVSPVAQLWLGVLARRGLLKIKPLEGESLPPTYDTSWDNGKGTICDGLINHSVTDTQGMLIMRPAKKEIVLSMRGTETTGARDAWTDVSALKTAAYGGKVHSGILNAWRSIEQGVLGVLQSLFQEKTEGQPSYDTLVLCGHSLGGGLATLAAASVSETFSKSMLRMFVYTYGSAVVGDQAFRQQFDTMVPYMYRVVNNTDAIPRLVPPGFSHVGKKVLINRKGLWVDLQDESIHDDLKEGVVASLKDHGMGSYAKLLESFSALCNSKWTTEGPDGPPLAKPIEGSELEGLLLEAWRVYVSASAEVAHTVKPIHILASAGDCVKIIRPVVPDTEGMRKTLKDSFPGVPDELTALIEPEMDRLRFFYDGEKIDCLVFNIACFNILFKGGHGMVFNQKRVRLWESYMNFDIDQDFCLSPAEFEAFYRRLNPAEQSVPATEFERFKKIGIEFEKGVHFREYMLARTVEDEEHVDRSGEVFDALKRRAASVEWAPPRPTAGNLAQGAMAEMQKLVESLQGELKSVKNELLTFRQDEHARQD